MGPDLSSDVSYALSQAPGEHSECRLQERTFRAARLCRKNSTRTVIHVAVWLFVNPAQRPPSSIPRRVVPVGAGAAIAFRMQSGRERNPLRVSFTGSRAAARWKTALKLKPRPEGSMDPRSERNLGYAAFVEPMSLQQDPRVRNGKFDEIEAAPRASCRDYRSHIRARTLYCANGRRLGRQGHACCA